jgi:hypothetical protein
LYNPLERFLPTALPAIPAGGALSSLLAIVPQMIEGVVVATLPLLTLLPSKQKKRYFTRKGTGGTILSRSLLCYTARYPVLVRTQNEPDAKSNANSMRSEKRTWISPPQIPSTCGIIEDDRMKRYEKKKPTLRQISKRMGYFPGALFEVLMELMMLLYHRFVE